VVTREEERARTSHDKKSWFVLVMHRLGLSWVPPLCPPTPSCVPPSSATATGPHPYEQGRGTGWALAPWLGPSWGGDGVVVVVEEGRMNQASTIDAVDG